MCVCVCDKVSSVVPVLKEHDFRDDPQIFYQFVEHRKKRATVKQAPPSTTVKQAPPSTSSLDGGATKRERSVSSADRSSVSSLLDECFDTIAHLGPEAMLYAILAKRYISKGVVWCVCVNLICLFKVW